MSTQERQHSGWLEFTAIVMFAVGFFRIITAIAYFEKSTKIDDLRSGLFSNHLWAWGIWDLLSAATAIAAGCSLLGGGAFGRVIGYIWAILVIVQGFVVISVAPWYGAAALALGALVAYGLSATTAETSP